MVNELSEIDDMGHLSDLDEDWNVAVLKTLKCRVSFFDESATRENAMAMHVMEDARLEKMIGGSCR